MWSISVGPILYNYSTTQVAQFLLALVPITKGNLSNSLDMWELCAYAPKHFEHPHSWFYRSKYLQF